MHILPIIDTNQGLNDYSAVLATKEVIALDTEFLRVRTFFPKPGLFQVNDGENIALIDPLAIDEWAAFSSVLSNPAIVKVLHACDEDIELLHHFLGIEVTNVFDTQVAAAFCDYDFCMGYQRLVAAMFDEDIEKGESRSDWMQRPLTPNQIRYAANDVVYLLEMHRKLSKQLECAGYDMLVRQECDAVFLNISNNDFSESYRRVKQAWKLNASQFARLKALASWREEKMRSENMPRNKIAKNEALMLLSVRPQWHKSQMFKVEGLPAAIVESFSDELLTLVADEYVGATDVMSKPLKSDSLLNSFKEALLVVAEDAGIAEKMLSKKAYNELVFIACKANKGNVQVESVVAAVPGWRQRFYRQAVESMSLSS